MSHGQPPPQGQPWSARPSGPPPYPPPPPAQPPYPPPPPAQPPHPPAYVGPLPPAGPRTGRTLAIIAAVLLGLGGLAVLALLAIGLIARSEDGSARPTSRPVKTISGNPTSSGPGGTVTTECYTFAQPHDYELKAADSRGCQAHVNIEGSDVLTAFDVGPLHNKRASFDAQVTASAQAIRTAGGTLRSQQSITVAGRRAVRFHYLNDLGLTWQYVLIDEPSPHWRMASGETADLFAVVGPDLPQIDVIVDSLAFR